MPVTLGERIAAAKTRFAGISTSPALDAQLLMAAIIGENRAHVIAHPERLLTDEEVARFEAWVQRRVDGEPIAYILGRRAFYDREFAVTPAVLVPRPETEHLIEAALDIIAAYPPEQSLTAVDTGTGSGAIAITVKANAPQIAMHATDISPDALVVARDNAAAQQVDVRFHHGDLLAPLIDEGIRADLVLANLPYIAADVLATLAVARHEPRLALDGGPDGLVLFRRLFAQVPMATNPGARLLLEIGADQGESVPALARAMLRVANVRVMQDYAGLDRVVEVALAES